MLTTSSGSSQIAAVCLSLPSSLWVSECFCNQMSELTDIVNPPVLLLEPKDGCWCQEGPFLCRHEVVASISPMRLCESPRLLQNHKEVRVPSSLCIILLLVPHMKLTTHTAPCTWLLDPHLTHEHTSQKHSLVVRSNHAITKFSGLSRTFLPHCP